MTPIEHIERDKSGIQDSGLIMDGLNSLIKDEFASGVNAMAGHCLAALRLVREGKWTIDDVERWLKAVQSNDHEELVRFCDEVLKTKELGAACVS